MAVAFSGNTSQVTGFVNGTLQASASTGTPFGTGIVTNSATTFAIGRNEMGAIINEYVGAGDDTPLGVLLTSHCSYPYSAWFEGDVASIVFLDVRLRRLCVQSARIFIFVCVCVCAWLTVAGCLVAVWQYAVNETSLQPYYQRCVVP